MMPIRDSVGIRDPWAMFDEKGEIKEDLVYGNPAAQVEQLLWWAAALKAAC